MGDVHADLEGVTSHRVVQRILILPGGVGAALGQSRREAECREARSGERYQRARKQRVGCGGCGRPEGKPNAAVREPELVDHVRRKSVDVGDPGVLRRTTLLGIIGRQRTWEVEEIRGQGAVVADVANSHRV